MYDKDLLLAIIVTTVSIFSLIIIVIVTLSNSYRQRLQQQITLSKTQLHYEQELRTVEQEVQETVMNHISQELHDNIGQLLTLMRVQVEQGKKQNPDATPVLLSINETLANTIKQVRLLSYRLNSEHIERHGLRDTIAQEVTRLQQLGYITIHFTSDQTEPALNKDQRLMSFRIFQEMLNNTLKHAQAQNIYIRFEGTDHFHLQVKDDGVGFDLVRALEQNGNGLRNMQKRAALAGLEFNITSSPGTGCTYAVQHMDAAAGNLS